jgi:hypothetical protein
MNGLVNNEISKENPRKEKEIYILPTAEMVRTMNLDRVECTVPVRALNTPQRCHLAVLGRYRQGTLCWWTDGGPRRLDGAVSQDYRY